MLHLLAWVPQCVPQGTSARSGLPPDPELALYASNRLAEMVGILYHAGQEG